MLLLTLLSTLMAQDIFYFKSTFGHIHRRADRDSESVSTIACAHPLEVKVLSGAWNQVKSGAYKGFVRKHHLVSRPPACLQKKYPKFFGQLNLAPLDRYLWGRLYDRYVFVETPRP